MTTSSNKGDLSGKWRLGEGMELGVPVIFIRNCEQILFRTNISQEAFTDKWYKETRSLGQDICDFLNTEEKLCAVH